MMQIRVEEGVVVELGQTLVKKLHWPSLLR